jgi:hypothetical protein
MKYFKPRLYNRDDQPPTDCEEQRNPLQPENESKSKYQRFNVTNQAVNAADFKEELYGNLKHTGHQALQLSDNRWKKISQQSQYSIEDC